MGGHPEDSTAPGTRSGEPAGTAVRRSTVRRPGRARRHLPVAGFVLVYLAAGGVTLALGGRVAGGGWLALHLVLLGAASNAIVVWSEHFTAALLRAPPASERVATGRALALNLGILGVLVGVHTGRTALAAGGACLAGAVVLAHALTLAARIGRALPGRLEGTVWFYPAAGAALLAGMGLGLWLAGGVAVAAAGLATQRRGVALAGLAAYAAGLAVTLVPFVRTARRRPPHTAASFMLAAGMAWLAVAVVADLGALAASSRVVDLDGRLSRLVPAVVAGFGLQTLTGALTYLLPVVFGRGAWGNRRLAGILELGWPARVAAVNLGVLALVAGAPPVAGWWLAGLGLGSFVPLAAVALAASTRGP
jgi:nitrite reductase (NO-forming)